MEEKMESQRVVIEASGLFTPLGLGVEENFQAVVQGRTCLKTHQSVFGVREPFVASLFERQDVERRFLEVVQLWRQDKNTDEAEKENYTFFEKITIIAINDALQRLPKESKFRLDSPSTLLVLSTTKGNVTLLQTQPTDARILLGGTAQHIARFFGMKQEPVVVSNACISGLSAQILAQRLLSSQAYRHIIVAGADEQSRFIVSGFQSFKALSPNRCRPYDAARDGLNLGEAAAAMVLSTQADSLAPSSLWGLAAGAVRNDANHISGPSRVGEGSFQALESVMKAADVSSLAFINAHGTATLYNDEMESIAISRANLSSVPVNALKGIYGHTMGAAGIMESLLSIEALRRGVILPTEGFSKLGVSRQLKVTNEEQHTEKRSFIKLMSGFGGCNAAVRYRQYEKALNKPVAPLPASQSRVLHSVCLDSNGILKVDGKNVETTGHGVALLTALYRKHVNDYPKFFKMDLLCRLGFVATELLLAKENDLQKEKQPRNDRAVVVCSRYGSYANDYRYSHTITDDNYFPSPAVFVYTLPNIVTGEIAIRHHYQGETSCFVLPDYQPQRVKQLAETAFLDRQTQSVVSAWLDARDEDCFEAHVELIVREK